MASLEGVSLLAPLGPITEGLITSIMPSSFTEGWGRKLEVFGDGIWDMERTHTHTLMF